MLRGLRRLAPPPHQSQSAQMPSHRALGLRPERTSFGCNDTDHLPREIFPPQGMRREIRVLGNLWWTCLRVRRRVSVATWRPRVGSNLLVNGGPRLFSMI